MYSRTLVLVVSLFFSLSAFSFTVSEVLERGLNANEKLMSFLLSHQCEVGLIDSCNRKPLSPQELITLKTAFLELAAWKDEVYGIHVPAKDWIQGRKYQLVKGNQFALSTSGNELIVTLAEDASSQEAIQEIQEAGSLQLVMYDYFFRIADLFSKASHLGTIITTDLPTEGKVFQRTFSTALNETNWKRTSLLINFLKDSIPFASRQNNRYQSYLNSSFTAKRMIEKDVLFYAKTVILFRTVISQNNLLTALSKIGGELSKIFGNNVGKVQVRSGKLKAFADDPEKMKSFKRKLKPLDILFERTPFRLTDYFIPGHYGHVAIWLGTPEELMAMTVKFQGKNIPLLDHPSVRPHLEKLSLGKMVLEALREPGVTMNTLEHFMDIDDFLVTRSLNKTDPAEYLVKAFEQVGKPYDFNFDVETEKEIVCSELIYRAFDDVTWPTARDMGRYTISPDHVAWKTVDNCYSVQLLYHDGKEIVSNKVAYLRDLLVKGGIKYTSSGSCY